MKIKFSILVVFIFLVAFTSCKLGGDDSGSSSSDANFTLEGSGGN